MLDFLSAFSTLTTLNCVFFFMLMAGIIWTTIVLIGGAVAGVDLPDMDVDIPHIDLHVDHGVSFDHGSVGVSPLSPITIASFVTSFGGLGLISTQLLRIPDTISLFLAAVGASVIAAGMFFLYGKVLIAGQGSSEVRMAEISGQSAEVIVPIPKDGLGQVAFVARGARTTWSARADDGKPISRGTIVTIRSVTGNTMIVSRL